jgi:hypothetical protein
MIRSEFDHLLSTIKALTPEEMRQLRQQLDRQLAERKKPRSQPSAKTSKQRVRYGKVDTETYG